MRSFDTLTEREILAMAISQEEEDARIYDNFAEGLRDRYPEQAQKFTGMRHDEDSHRHRLLDLYQTRFGAHVPLIRRQDVHGFVGRRPVWLVRPLGLEGGAEGSGVDGAGDKAVLRSRRQARRPMRGPRQLLGDLAEEERHHAAAAEHLVQTGLTEAESDHQRRLFVLQVIHRGWRG